MPDHFALLNEPRRPWLEPEALKQKFIELSANVHPDRVHSLGEAERTAAQERYVALNAAYQCLREPRDRLRHLLELELGALPKDIQRVPPDLMDVFMEISQAGRQADSLLAEQSKATSPLLKVQFFERSQELRDHLLELQRKIGARRELLLTDLGRMDGEWVSGSAQQPAQRAQLLAALEAVYRLFSYFDRWLAQLQERVVRLSI